MLSTILVPLDGSPLAEHALPYAERLAAASSARLVLGSVATATLQRTSVPLILIRPASLQGSVVADEPVAAAAG